MQPEIVTQIENIKESYYYYCGILRNDTIKVDIETIINHCWIAWSNNFSFEILDFVNIFEIILKSNGVRIGNCTAFYKDDYIPNLDPKNKMDFMYIDMDYYTDDLQETNFIEIINSNWQEKEFKTLFINYLTWLGYIQK